MNFFEHQTQAKKNTTRLVVLFAVAMACIIGALYLIAIGIWHFIQVYTQAEQIVKTYTIAFSWWQPYVLASVAGGVLLVVACGSLWKVYRLTKGGSAVAFELGARCIASNTTDPDERRLLNVVEEMAIASGVPVPLVFVLDKESGINALAAGYTPNDAAVAVTAGCLKVMNRDELQGIIAHEFSHILNGDMRLNIRLIGLIHGILIIYIIGLTVIRSMAYSRSSSRKGGGAIVAILATGAALALIGYLGVFFGRLIKAAISREREYLADASAVDFTRNPDGIAHALIKIGGYGSGSRIDSAEGETVSHMLFGDWRVKGFQTGGILSTHPPLVDRIQRVYPAFDGKFPKIPAITVDSPSVVKPIPGAAGMVSAAAAVVAIAAEPGDVIQRVGTLDPAQLSYGAALIASIPEDYRRSAREPARAVCLVYALLLDDDEAERRRQYAILKDKIKPALRKEMMRLFRMRSELRPSARLPLLEIATPALRQLTTKQREVFLDQVQSLVEADNQTTIFEFAITNLLRRSLTSAEDPKRREARYYSFSPLRNASLQVLSALAHVGAEDDDQARIAFLAGAKKLPRSGPPLTEPLPATACAFSRMGEALEKLSQASPVLKSRVVDAMAYCVLGDGKVTVEEAELLRVICATMDCPMPPFLPTAAEAKLEA